MSVSQRFSQFLDNIALTSTQVTSGREARESVVETLNAEYWKSASKTNNSKFVGSWGKFTQVRPPRDVDVLFLLPTSVYTRFEGRSGNKQSQLLQEVKGVLSDKFRSTAIKGDGPVVIVPFASYAVELIPAFSLTDGKYWICMTDMGGYYKTADYDAEASYIATVNQDSKGNLRDLVRMMKRWQSYCSVPIKSFWIEIVAAEFISGWGNKGKSALYYDLMVRDFLSYLKSKRYGVVYAPGT